MAKVPITNALRSAKCNDTNPSALEDGEVFLAKRGDQSALTVRNMNHGAACSDCLEMLPQMLGQCQHFCCLGTEHFLSRSLIKAVRKSEVPPMGVTLD
jgi:hypothetical protein